MGSSDLAGARVLVMGLGAHGGGAATARYCALAGARVTVTDLRSEESLRESVDSLSDLPIRFVLGRHEADDAKSADIVVKNPAVPRRAPLLAHARRIETDISLFLARHTGPVLAVTGTKGKSTTASALHHLLLGSHARARLGGNITVSPLTFLPELAGAEPVVLELSSFQLGDLLLTPEGQQGVRPSFAVSAITNLMPDHQDYYGSMEAYANDKAVIFSGQSETDWCILSDDDRWSRAYAPPYPQRVVRFVRQSAGTASRAHRGQASAYFDGAQGFLSLPGTDPQMLVSNRTRLEGAHMRRNLLVAAVAARLFGLDPAMIRDRTAAFEGVPHRLESVATIDGVLYVNDSAATIAEAALAAVSTYNRPVRLIAGGSDKGVPLDDFVEVARRAASLHLLEGTATPRIVALLDAAGLAHEGPYDSLAGALAAASAAATPGDVVLLSPGCASFGMFRNEFDRGDQFRRLVQSGDAW